MLTIIANIHAHPDHIERVKSELERLIPVTRAEAGCIQYDLHQNTEDPTHFTFYENWESRELWQDHMTAPHLVAWMKVAEEAVAKFSVDEFSRIG